MREGRGRQEEGRKIERGMGEGNRKRYGRGRQKEGREREIERGKGERKGEI